MAAGNGRAGSCSRARGSRRCGGRARSTRSTGSSGGSTRDTGGPRARPPRATRRAVRGATSSSSTPSTTSSPSSAGSTRRAWTDSCSSSSTASRAEPGRLLVHEPLTRVRQPHQEGGQLPDRAVLALELEHPGLERLEPHLVGPEHRATPVHGPTVTVDPDDVDVARADREPLLENLRPFVHHRAEQALEDLRVGDRAPLDPRFPRDPEDDLLDLGVRDRRAIAPRVAVVARARLLAEAPHLAEPVGDGRREPLALPDPPADVKAGEVAHRERPHRETEVEEDLVYMLWQGAFAGQSLRLLPGPQDHA